jgi:hypothetical protein
VTQPINPGQSPFAPPEPGPVPGQPAPQPGQPIVPSFIPPTVAAAVAKPQSRKGASAGTMAFVAAVVVAAAGLGFAGGRLTAPATTTRGNGQFGNVPGGSFSPNASGGANRGGFGLGGGNVSITGQVTAISNGSITIQTSNGQSVTLQVPATVTYHAQASAAPTDVAVGTNVQVSVSRGGGRNDASGQPAASGQPGAGGGTGGFGGFSMTVTDITVVSK